MLTALKICWLFFWSFQQNFIYSIYFLYFFRKTMATRRQLKPEERRAIIRGIKQGMSHNCLANQFGVSRSTIFMCWLRFKDRNEFCDSRRSGRPRKTTARTDRAIKHISVKDPTKTGPQIRAEICKNLGTALGVTTVKSRLRNQGLFGRRPAKKPFVSLKNRRARINFAKKHLSWSFEQWWKVLFFRWGKVLSVWRFEDSIRASPAWTKIQS